MSLARDRAPQEEPSTELARGAVLTGRTLADLVQTALTLVVLAVVALLVGWRVGSNGDTNVGKVLVAFGLLLLLGYAFTWIGRRSACPSAPRRRPPPAA